MLQQRAAYVRKRDRDPTTTSQASLPLLVLGAVVPGFGLRSMSVHPTMALSSKNRGAREDQSHNAEQSDELGSCLTCALGRLRDAPSWTSSPVSVGVKNKE